MNKTNSARLNRALLLDLTNDVVNRDREGAYGKPEDSFGMIAEFWTVFLIRRKPGPIAPYEVAIMLDLMKTARLTAANGAHPDSWIDKAGYAACGAEAAHLYVPPYPSKSRPISDE